MAYRKNEVDRTEELVGVICDHYLRTGEGASLTIIASLCGRARSTVQAWIRDGFLADENVTETGTTWATRQWLPGIHHLREQIVFDREMSKTG